MLTWENTYEIAARLREVNPGLDPEKISLEMLFHWTVNLPDFTDDPELSNDEILMTIFQEWFEEVEL